MSIVRKLLAIVAGVCLAASAAEANLLLNPSFENNTGGSIGQAWVDDLGQSVVLPHTYGGGPGSGFWVGATHGSNYLFMGNSAAAGAIHQDLSLTGGQDYLLSFDLANFLSPFGSNGAKLTVNVIDLSNNTSILGSPQVFTRPVAAGYASQSMSFTIAATGNYRLTVESASGFGTNVDNFNLVVPEPTSLSLLGLGGMMMLRRKRKN